MRTRTRGYLPKKDENGLWIIANRSEEAEKWKGNTIFNTDVIDDLRRSWYTQTPG
ncbi:hypothetical protein CPB84DRAFT_372381 [Gymnopilus junonius]|uniref:Uncharacterized protein n=1 Tax=Gymnopilus junonius TaxID=109634 RepID=A0A9P5NCW9_GYMJU|nr:hypothetical protein CPB84DRAFT_372381 [Gymnopilus junonius]